MTQHVFARLVGFHLTVIPRAPFRIQYADADSVAIEVEYKAPTGQFFACLIPGDGGYRSKIDQHTGSLLDVLDVEAGPDVRHWRVATSVFTCCWPRDYALCSNNFPNDPGPFDFMGRNGEMIYIQCPTTIPDIADLCGPSQSIVKIERTPESEWIELEYKIEGQLWRRRHVFVTLLDRRIVVTMQAPFAFAAQAADATISVARSLAPHNDA